jgi:hypothetical protein
MTDDKGPDAAKRGLTMDRFGKQIALGVLVVFAAVMAGALGGKDPMGALALILLAMGIYCTAILLPADEIATPLSEVDRVGARS